MKSIKTAAVLVFISGIILSCKKSLELTPVGIYLDVNYYTNPDQAFTGVVAAYNPLVSTTGGLNELEALNAASDDCFAGGGSIADGANIQAINNYTLNSGSGPQGYFWTDNYQGVNRCNVLLQKLNGVPGLSDALLKRYTAEAKFLRAHYYFDLVRLFKNIPLITEVLETNNVYNQTQVPASAIYAQIESDLNAAIPNLPITVAATENGRATQGAANALLGKVYLYEKKWAPAAATLALVNGSVLGNSTYGYKLLPNYGAIFNIANKFNSESIFEINKSSTQNYDVVNTNAYTLYVGPRGYSGPVYYGLGFGFNPLTSNLVNAIKSDPRYPYTVANIDSIAKASGGAYTQAYQGSGYYIQKFAPLLANTPSGSNAGYNFPNDYIEIRLADTYLMEAEALIQSSGNIMRAQALLDAVRSRVKLSSIPVTLASIYNERRLELATEGHRWFDLVRTGQAPTILSFKGFKVGVNEILPIPLSDLNNTKLVQNPGY